MLEHREGQSIPAVSLQTLHNGAIVSVSSESLFADKQVILFALPGAFTPTCSSSHLPRYQQLAPLFKQQGIDSIICLSVNDAFVLDAWQADQQVDQITFMADGNGVFTEQMGMLVDKQALGFGRRSWRYSMLVKHGVIDKMFIEPDEPGDPFKVSDADTMLKYLAPQVQESPHVTLLVKSGCPFCQQAKQALQQAGMAFESIVLGQAGVSYSSLFALSGQQTAPQAFVDGVCIGDSKALQAWLQARG